LHVFQCHGTYPETLHHLVLVNTELLGVTASELTDSESPAVKTRTESDGTLFGVDLAVTKSLVEVCGNNDIDGLDDTREVLVKILLGKLELEKSTVDLVDDDNRLNALTKSLTEHGLGLDTDTFNGVDDNEGTIGDTEGSSNFGREIDVTRRIDQVNQKLVLRGLAGNLLEILLVDKLCEQRDGSGLDGDTTFLLIGAGICESSLTSLGC